MINIRLAKMEDLEVLSVLFDNYRVFYEQASDVEAGKAFLRERMEYKESVIFVSENENHIITGFIQLYPLFSSTRMKRLWLLNDLYVDDSQRGLGIGEALMETSKSFVLQTKACAVILETAKTNIIGNQLYSKVGFQLDLEHNYYAWENK